MFLCDKFSLNRRLCREFSHFAVPAIREVNIQGGSAHATSTHPAPWTPDKAFSVGHNYAWHNNGDNNRLPSIVWYVFPVGQTFIPARVSFRARQDCCLQEGPTVWQFVGSNDPNCWQFGDWTVLCEDKSDVGYRNKALTKYCDVDERILKEFKCLGISVLNTHSKHSIASLRDVRIWRKILK